MTWAWNEMSCISDACLCCLDVWLTKAGQDVEAFACGGAFEKANFMLWTGILMTHAVVSKSGWALVFQVEVDE